ncbi:MAG: hypothetical protein WB952_08135 [Terriglobales bacterium]
MNPSLKAVSLIVVIYAASVSAQHVGTIEYTDSKQARITKAENGLIVSWVAGRSYDAEGDQVNIFDELGHPLTKLNVLHLVKEARGVSIYDVTARPDSIIAMAAVYASKEGNNVTPPVASLLLFDFTGRLLSAFSLEPSHAILRLALDEKSNVWTLTDAGDLRDTIDPMIVEYTQDGLLVKEIAIRNLFSSIEVKQDFSFVWTSMNYDYGRLWIWLSGPADLITMNTQTDKPTITKTGLPDRANRREVQLSQVIREPSGDIVAQFREDGKQGEREIAYYRWSESQMLWSRFKPGACDGERLIGRGATGQIYARQRANQTDICSFH